MSVSPTPDSSPGGPSAAVLDASAAVDELEAAAKRWWQSRTIVVNVLAAAFLVAESKLDLLQPLLPVDVYAVAAFALPVINAALRFVTSQAIR